jgi:four helix bundle protein
VPVNVRSHKDLVVWQKAMNLAEHVYALVALFPPTEKYRMVDQLTRAAISVPANIAEGHGRSTRKDYAQFVSIAIGSLAETETYLILCERLHFCNRCTTSSHHGLVEEVGKMLKVLRVRLRGPVPLTPNT